VELLFDIVATAYQRQSLIMNANLPFENWTEVFGSEHLTGIELDRMTHAATSSIPQARGIALRMPSGLAERSLRSKVLGPQREGVTIPAPNPNSADHFDR
jgi:hypothetical protein